MKRPLLIPDPNVALVAALIGDPARCAMLHALLGGHELSATELALRAGVSPQSASAHLSKLVAGGLIERRTSGRRRLLRLASPEVASAIEALQAIAPAPRLRSLAQSNALQRLREARTCYDHLAGRLGVAIADRLVARRALVRDGDAFKTARSGERLFAALGVDIGELTGRRRVFARPCMDWTQRRPHIAGALGAAMLERFFALHWFERNDHDRSLLVTATGREALSTCFEIDSAHRNGSRYGELLR